MKTRRRQLPIDLSRTPWRRCYVPLRSASERDRRREAKAAQKRTHASVARRGHNAIGVDRLRLYYADAHVEHPPPLVSPARVRMPRLRGRGPAGRPRARRTCSAASSGDPSPRGSEPASNGGRP